MTGIDPLTTAWRCPRCDAERAGEDAFCGRCGAPRPADGPAAGAAGGETTADATRVVGRPIRRALILNGIIVGAIIIAVLVGRTSEPGSIAFQPTTWRCDGTERAWVATLPLSVTELRLEWHSGGPEGPVRASATTTQAALAPVFGADGSVRVTTTVASAPECGLPAGTWTLVIRDAASDVLLAAGTVELRAP